MHINDVYSALYDPLACKYLYRPLIIIITMIIIIVLVFYTLSNIG